MASVATVAAALSNSFMPQDIQFAVSHDDANVREKARAKALIEIKTLDSAGVLKPIIYHLMATTFIMMHNIGKLSLTEHHSFMNQCLTVIYPDDEYRADLLRQLLTQKALLRAKAQQFAT